MVKTFSDKYKTNNITIYPGEIYVSNKNELITTVLGSCISICLYDNINGISGLNHYMLPEQSNKNIKCTIDKTKMTTLRYGEIANVELLKQMIRLGANKNYIKAKIYGGASVLSKMTNVPTIGKRNILCAESFLKENNIPVISEDTGSSCGRKISFFTNSNEVLLKKINSDISDESGRSIKFNSFIL
jgi:chemotaxis protein CheD